MRAFDPKRPQIIGSTNEGPKRIKRRESKHLSQPATAVFLQLLFSSFVRWFHKTELCLAPVPSFFSSSFVLVGFQNQLLAHTSLAAGFTGS